MIHTIGFISLIGGSLNFYGFQRVPLNEASVIFQTQPAISSILAVFILGEAYDLTQLLCTIFCTIGVILVTKPIFIFGETFAKHKNEQSDQVKGVVSLLLSAFVISSQSIAIKKIIGSINTNLSVFYIGLIPSLLVSCLMLNQGIKEMSYHKVIAVINITIQGFLGQVLYNRAYKFGDAGKIALMGYSQIIFGYLLDIYVLETTPDFYSTMGAMSIFCRVFLKIFQTWRNDQKKKNIKCQAECKQRTLENTGFVIFGKNYPN